MDGASAVLMNGGRDFCLIRFIIGAYCLAPGPLRSLASGCSRALAGARQWIAKKASRRPFQSAAWKTPLAEELLHRFKGNIAGQPPAPRLILTTTTLCHEPFKALLLHRTNQVWQARLKDG
jgi:hypothetical protein